MSAPLHTVAWHDSGSYMLLALSRYEGLARDNACEVRGVISYPNGDR